MTEGEGQGERTVLRVGGGAGMFEGGFGEGGIGWGRGKQGEGRTGEDCERGWG